MKHLLIAASLLLSLPAFAEPVCTAVSRTNDGKKLTEQPMSKVYSDAASVKWEADIGPIYYMVMFDKDNEDYLVMITRGPAYQDGISLRGVFNKRGELRASWVSPEETWQVLCKK